MESVWQAHRVRFPWRSSQPKDLEYNCKMTTAIVIHEKDLLKKPEENNLERDDRQNLERFRFLGKQKKRSKVEEKEHAEVEEKVISKYMLNHGSLPNFFADTDLQRFVRRIHDELASQYILDTPLKRILVDRVTSAWSMAHTYERMLKMAKYKESEDGTYNPWNCSHERTGYLKEIRRGIESANDQIIRLSQALQNLSSPPVQLQVKNAFFAQNQQVNQAASSKDLEKIPEATNYAKACA